MTAVSADRGRLEPALSYQSSTPAGRAILLAMAERNGLPAPDPERGDHGLDLEEFTDTVRSQRHHHRANGPRTLTLGPMQVDVRLVEGLKAYVAEHRTSQRVVLELLLQELLGRLPAARA